MHDVDRTLAAAGPLVKEMAAKVARFNHELVGYPVPDAPRLLDEDRQAFRMGFLREELAEIDAAYTKGDLGEVVDGHVDAVYVHLGALYEMGVCAGPAFDLVHDANMQKKRGTKSTRPGSQGYDTVKPTGWKAPDHAELLTITSEDVRNILDVKASRAMIVWDRDRTSNRKADLLNITPQEIETIRALREGTLSTTKGRRSFLDEQQEIGKIVYTRELKANDDFEFVGHPTGDSRESQLIGADGYVLSVKDRTADVRFYRSDLPQLMTVSLREIKYKAKRQEIRNDRKAAVAVTTETKRRPRLMVMGYARHGKDTVCELLGKEYGARFTSSSAFCADRVVFPYVEKAWKEHNPIEAGPLPFPHYDSAQECFEDRHNHRALWYDLITRFNTPDLTALGRAIFERHDLYCGIRNAREFHALRNAGVFDVAVWVDASERVGSKEDRSSCTVESWMADYVLDNNGDVRQLEHNLRSLMVTLQERRP